jgi:hypothetical protein
MYLKYLSGSAGSAPFRLPVTGQVFPVKEGVVWVLAEVRGLDIRDILPEELKWRRLMYPRSFRVRRK